MAEEYLTDKEKEELIKNNPKVRIFIETFEETINDTLNELTQDIMSIKSLSYAEANHIAKGCLLRCIKPKSDEFYKVIDKVKTAWE